MNIDHLEPTGMCDTCGHPFYTDGTTCDPCWEWEQSDTAPKLWKVTLRADGGTYRHLIVSGATKSAAIVAACNIELAPKRSVVNVEAYREAN